MSNQLSHQIVLQQLIQMKLTQFLRSAEESAAEAAQFTGWRKYYNSTTQQGRFGCTVITYAGCALIGLFMYLKPKKPKQIEAKK